MLWLLLCEEKNLNWTWTWGFFSFREKTQKNLCTLKIEKIRNNKKMLPCRWPSYEGNRAWYDKKKIQTACIEPKLKKMSRRQANAGRYFYWTHSSSFKRICGHFTFFFRRSVLTRPGSDRPSIVHKKEEKTFFAKKNVANYTRPNWAHFLLIFHRECLFLCPFRITFVAQKVFSSLLFDKKNRIKKESLLLEKNIYVFKLEKLSSVSPLKLISKTFLLQGQIWPFPI